jgi:cell division protein FtsW (lipid II flippase)
MSYGGSAILINLVAMRWCCALTIENRQLMRGGV